MLQHAAWLLTDRSSWGGWHRRGLPQMLCFSHHGCDWCGVHCDEVIRFLAGVVREPNWQSGWHINTNCRQLQTIENIVETKCGHKLMHCKRHTGASGDLQTGTEDIIDNAQRKYCGNLWVRPRLLTADHGTGHGVTCNWHMKTIQTRLKAKSVLIGNWTK